MFQLQLFFLLHCDEWDRVVALPRHKFVTGATLLQLYEPRKVQDTRYFIFQIRAPGGHDTFIISTYTINKVKYNNYFITINHVCFISDLLHTKCLFHFSIYNTCTMQQIIILKKGLTLLAERKRPG